MVRYVIGVDPSGNFNEGKGHTGIAIYDTVEDRIVDIDMTYAGDYDTWLAFFAATWQKILWYLEHFSNVDGYDNPVMSIENYVLYGHKMHEQTNSELETARAVGYLIMKAFEAGYHVYMRRAVDVKSRWSEDVLVRLGYIQERSGKYYFNGKSTATHHRDAMKHAIHCGRFECNKSVKKNSSKHLIC